MHLFSRFWQTVLLFAVFSVLSASSVRAEDIVTIASKDPQFSTLVQLIQAADLVDALKQRGPFTVLAPNNDAFAKVPKEKLSELLKPENKNLLRKVLLYHVAAGKITSAELSGMSVGMKGPALSGDELTITSLDPPKVNEATIIKANILADNGVIHVVDTVLMPPMGNAMPSTATTRAGVTAVTTPLGTETITALAAADPQFSTLVKLLKTTGLDETLGKRGPLTVFAPTNAAFAKLPASTLEMLMLPENASKLIDILLYHVVPGQFVAADVSGLNGQSVPTTLRGKTLMISTTGGVKVNNANVVKTDIGAKNGVIHVIDTVLLPPMQ